MAPHSQLSQEELDRRKTIGVTSTLQTNIHSSSIPGHYAHGDDPDATWSHTTFAQTLRCEVHSFSNPHDLTFSLIGLDASIANAFRRIMIAEVPTLAIEDVYVNNNTSIIQDEVLAHRLGLIPLRMGKDPFTDFFRWFKPYGRWARQQDTVGADAAATAPEPFDYNTILLSLKVECTRNPKAEKGETDPLKAYKNAHVYAHQLEWQIVGNQHEKLAGDNAVVPVNPDILIAKLRPGQAIDIEMHAIKGIGADHAKFSPVATATYRLMPTIDILSPIVGKDAEKFAKCFPKGVISLEKVTKEEYTAKGGPYEGLKGEKKAVVKNPMLDTVSREVLRHEEFEGKVRLGRRRDHFIFSVESTGQWDSDELFLEAVAVLKKKCQRMKEALGVLES